MEVNEEDRVGVSNETQPMSTGFVVVLYCKAAINLLACIICFFFIVAMLADKKIRNNAYNLYVVFMILPDGINTFFRVLTNLFIATNHGVRWFPSGYYYLDLFFWMFYYISNFYTNTIVTYEIDKLVRHSHQRKRVNPPTISKVLKQVGAVYLFGIFMSLLMVIPAPFALFYITNDRRGEGKSGSPPGGWVKPMVATMIGLGSVAIPVVYVLLVRIRIWKQKLLPETGRTRALSLFFLRVVIIFVVFYIPNVILTIQRQRMEDELAASFWVDTILGILAACQALTTLYMIWLKEDIRGVINETWNKTFGWIYCCCTCSDARQEIDIISGSVHVSGLSQPAARRKAEDSVEVVGLPSGDSHLVEQVQGAWSENDGHDELPQNEDTSDETPSATDVEHQWRADEK